MDIALIGRTHWLLDAGAVLAAQGHRIGLVATAQGRPEYRAQAEDFERFARDQGAAYFFEPDANSEAFASALAQSGAMIGVSVNWPKIIREPAANALRFGILNGHAGDLPRYRGNACPNWAILNGEPHAGFCVHAIVPGELDSGPVFERRALPLTEETYIADFYAWMDAVLPSMFVAAVEKASTPGFVPEDQAARGVKALRCQPRRPSDGLIDWTLDAAHIARLVRASSRPFAGAFSFLEGETRVTIWRARAVALPYDLCAVPGQILGRGPSRGVLIACGDNALEIEEAQLESGAHLPVSNAYRLMSQP